MRRGKKARVRRAMKMKEEKDRQGRKTTRGSTPCAIKEHTVRD